MKWGVFSLSQIPDLSRVPEAFDEDLAFFKHAEAIGYDTVWLAEHLFSNYGVVTSTQVLAAAVAQVTSTIKIGTAVVVIPFNHPLRTASDFALVDVLSKGRLLFGAGRAYQPHEFVGLDVPMGQSREMYAEGLDLVIKAWTNQTVEHDGEFWKVREPVEVLPKPIQKPHPPIYQACISPDSFRSAARKGLNLQLASPFTYRTYREEWIDKLAESVALYEAECEACGRDPKDNERMMLLPFFVDETTEKAKAIYGERVEWFYSKVTNNQNMGAGPTEVIKGYELTMTESRKTLAGGYLNFDKLHEHGAAIADDPETCAAKLNNLRERLGITEFVLWFNIAGMPAEHSTRAMELAMNEVIPRVNADESAKAAAE
jgi:alkanesulfonate monooxygenase SsuD/methylene tetrahydromethanopterin reductase-like flavin-dependent oxidoreductase (luciferase family)